MLRKPEIQGLRALAVTLVLLFHAGWLPGGYVGVDVFYVISGFLITNLILQDQQFSFRKFYSRRAKRLLPMAFVVLFITAISYYLFAPVAGRHQFSQDLLASAWYLSNYLYAHWQNDYQNLGSTPSPLIHYWSLAVEEQFYLFWPILLRVFKNIRKSFILCITIASFCFSIFLVSKAPIFAFYSLPTRAFELGIGGLLAVTKFRNRLGWIGFLGILSSSLLFNSQTSFPSWPALLPTIGAALVITNIGQIKFLSHKVLTKIGDWSYSIYLWHWPLLTIPPLYLQRNLTLSEKLSLLILCVGLSYLTYTYIENPTRQAKIAGRTILIGALVGSLFLSGTAFALDRTSKDGKATVTQLKQLEKPLIYQNGCHLSYGQSKTPTNCVFGDLKSDKYVVLFGDSHAAQWFPAIEQWAKIRKLKLFTFTKSSCPAFEIKVPNTKGDEAKRCAAFRKSVLARISQLKPEIVVISNFEHYGVDESNYYLKDIFAFKHLIIRDTPWPNRDIPACDSMHKQCDTPLPRILKYRSTSIFDPIPLLCKEKCPAVVDGLLAYRDQTHITVAMALHLAPKLEEELDSLVAG